VKSAAVLVRRTERAVELLVRGVAETAGHGPPKREQATHAGDLMVQICLVVIRRKETGLLLK
jgi:hypothetical protein